MQVLHFKISHYWFIIAYYNNDVNNKLRSYRKKSTHFLHLKMQEKYFMFQKSEYYADQSATSFVDYSLKRL